MRRRSGRPLFAVSAVVCVLVLAACTDSGSSPNRRPTGSAKPPSTLPSQPVGPAIPAGTPTVYLSPHGSGTSCSSGSPCGTLDAALATAKDHGVISAAGGYYPFQDTAKSDAVKQVTLQSAPGETAVFQSARIRLGGLTISHVAFLGSISVRRGPTVLDSIHVVGSVDKGTIYVRGDRTTIKDSLIYGGSAHDGIDIAGYPTPVQHVTVERTTIRDIGGDTEPKQAHPDCIQIYDAEHVTVRQNTLFNCYNSGITFSPGARHGIKHVLIQSNFIEGCIASRSRCGNGGSAMDLRVGSKGTLDVSDVVVEHNTFGVGSLRLPYQPGVVAPLNIVHYLSLRSPCTTSLEDSLISSFPTYVCKHGAPGRTLTSRSGNVTGKPPFVNPDAGNLRLTKRITIPVSGSNVRPAGPAVDIDGKALAADVPGAYQVGA